MVPDDHAAYFRRRPVRFTIVNGNVFGHLRRTILLAVALTIAPATMYASARAHLALRSSSPSAGAVLSEVPREIRLTFTERVEAGLSTIRMLGPAGAIPLDSLTQGADGLDLFVGLPGALGPGTYRVEWQAVGRDGHPVRGDFFFGIAAGAAGSEVPAMAPTDPSVAPLPEAELETRLEASSPLFAATRAVTFASLLGCLGVAAFLLIVIPGASRRDISLPHTLIATAERSAAYAGIVAVVALGVSMALRLQAQSHAVFGHGITARTMALLNETAWGLGFLLQAGGGILLLAGVLLRLRRRAVGSVVAAAGALALAFSPAMASHAASLENGATLAMLSDGFHVLAAGGWIGSLLLLLMIGLPLFRRVDASERSRVTEPFLTSFSSLALVAAAVVVFTGIAAAIIQLESPGDLWNQTYGRILSFKIAAVLAVMAVGAYNWRRITLRPQSDEGIRLDTLRKTAALELTFALGAVILTAVLVGEPSPVHERQMTDTTAPSMELATPE